eukprot:4673195-Prymnesium_polylepis.1
MVTRTCSVQSARSNMSVGSCSCPPPGKRLSCPGLWLCCFGMGLRDCSRLFTGAPVAVGFFRI